MTNAWYRKKRAALVAERGGRCEHVYHNGKRCRSRATLEFAHVKPTGLSGRSRGYTQRVQDAMRHPDHYKLLCFLHHRRLDGF